jgi:anti-sigma-K factor RskA
MEASQNSLIPLETRLARALMPVSAPQEFAQRLRGRIRLPEPGQIARRLNNWHFLFFVIGGVVSAAVIVTALARAIYFFARRKD